MDRMAQATLHRISRIALGCLAAVMALLVGVAHGFARAEAHRVSVFPALSAGRLEDWLLPGSSGASTWLQRIVPRSVGLPIATELWWSWFYLPVILCAVVMAVLGPRHFVRFLFLFAATLFAADLVFALIPSLPPWMTDGTPRLIAGTTGTVTALDTNPTAAFPSLHVAVPFVLALWFWRHERRGCQLAGRLLMLRTLLVFWAVVYTGEHFVLDGLGGIALGAAVYAALDRFGIAQERPATGIRTPIDIRQYAPSPLPYDEDDEYVPAAA
jgi:PAP2 superfamily protein